MRTYRIDFALMVITGNLTRYKTLRPLVEQDSSVRTRWYPIRTWIPRDWLRVFPAPLRVRLRHALDTWGLFVRPPADAVIIHAFETYPLYGLLRWLLRRETVLINNYDGEMPRPRPGIRGWPLRIAVRSTALFIPWSHFAAKITTDRWPTIPRDRLVVMHPGIDLDRWIRRVDPPAAERFRLLFVGGDLRRKGVWLLMDAFESGLADSCELHIATQSLQPDDDLERLRARVERAPCVHLHLDLQPNSPELRMLYRESDALVLPTSYDSSSWVALEALATGIPVVASQVGGIPDIVMDGETGLLIPPHDPDAFIAAVTRLRTDATLRARLVRQGRAHVEANFNAHTNTQRLLALTKRLIDQRRGDLDIVG